MPSRRYTPMPSPPSSEGSMPRRSAQHFDTQSYDRPGNLAALENDPDFDRHSMDFITVKNQPFAVSGRIPLDARNLTLFFRSQVSHHQSCGRYTIFDNLIIERHLPFH